MTEQPESLTSELDDLDVGDEEGFDWAGLDLRVLAHPVVLRSLGGDEVIEGERPTSSSDGRSRSGTRWFRVRGPR